MKIRESVGNVWKMYGNRIKICKGRREDRKREWFKIIRKRLLDKLDMEEAVVSIDAMGTQVNIAQKIVEKRRIIS